MKITIASKGILTDLDDTIWNDGIYATDHQRFSGNLDNGIATPRGSIFRIVCTDRNNGKVITTISRDGTYIRNGCRNIKFLQRCKLKGKSPKFGYALGNGDRLNLSIRKSRHFNACNSGRQDDGRQGRVCKLILSNARQSGKILQFIESELGFGRDFWIINIMIAELSFQTRHGRSLAIGQFTVTTRIPFRDSNFLDSIRLEPDERILIIHPPAGIQRRELDGILAVQRGGLCQCADDVVRNVWSAVVVDDLDEVFRFLSYDGIDGISIPVRNVFQQAAEGNSVRTLGGRNGFAVPVNPIVRRNVRLGIDFPPVSIDV